MQRLHDFQARRLARVLARRFRMKVDLRRLARSAQVIQRFVRVRVARRRLKRCKLTGVGLQAAEAALARLLAPPMSKGLEERFKALDILMSDRQRIEESRLASMAPAMRRRAEKVKGESGHAVRPPMKLSSLLHFNPAFFSVALQASLLLCCTAFSSVALQASLFSVAQPLSLLLFKSAISSVALRHSLLSSSCPKPSHSPSTSLSAPSPPNDPLAICPHPLTSSHPLQKNRASPFAPPSQTSPPLRQGPSV
eukprot:3383611-Pleurochrysis_carterae.AAC.1